jgi:DNA-binding MarR family transcriptional regulator
MAALTSSDSSIEPVTLSPADAAELARLLTLLIRDQPDIAAEILASLRQMAVPQSDPSAGTDRRKLVLRARTAFSERKRRWHFFNKIVFGEPAWEMLLALYITDFAGGRQTISKLVDWVDAPRTTASRWIDYLEKEALIERHPDPNDSRSVFVDLTLKAKRKLDGYFALAEPAH